MRYKNKKNLENNKYVRLYFDNKEYFGFEGDTLASALLANDVHLVGRSFKYHRPRGIYTAGSEEPNGIVQLETKEYTEPNRRVTEVQIYEGLKAFSQNNWPSVKFDAGAINDLLSPFFPAGFYYKTFMWPPKFWKAYEFFIRHAAGLGKSPKKDDPHKYEHFHYHCDVLVVGAGVSGLISAEIAANNNYKVLLIEQEDDLGGEILSSRNKDIKTIIFTSSVAIYGFAPPNTDEGGEANYFNDYGRTKWLAEQAYSKWYSEDTENRRLIIIRPTVIFGEGNRGNVYNLLKQIK